MPHPGFAANATTSRRFRASTFARATSVASGARSCEEWTTPNALPSKCFAIRFTCFTQVVGVVCGVATAAGGSDESGARAFGSGGGGSVDSGSGGGGGGSGGDGGGGGSSRAGSALAAVGEATAATATTAALPPPRLTSKCSRRSYSVLQSQTLSSAKVMIARVRSRERSPLEAEGDAERSRNGALLLGIRLV